MNGRLPGYPFGRQVIKLPRDILFALSPPGFF